MAISGRPGTFLDQTFFLLQSWLVKISTRQSMKRRITTKRLFTIYIARCGYTWLDESKWPQEWPISLITIVYLKIPSGKNEIFLFTQKTER